MRTATTVIPPPGQAYEQDFLERFEAHVVRTPNAVAVQCGSAQLTYQQLNQRANQFANHFQRIGVGPERLVAVGLPRSVENLAVLLGVWKARGAFLALDPEYPAERIAFMLRDSSTSLLITESQLLPRFTSAVGAHGPAGLPDIVCVDSARAAIAAEDLRNLELTTAAESLAYVTYTSGSTGKPKGVMITHANVAHYAKAMTEALGIVPSDRYLHTASFSFSSSIRQIVVPLANGAGIVIAATAEIRDPQALFETVRQRFVSVIDLVPSYSANCLQVLRAMESTARTALLENSLRLVLSASEPLPSAVVAGWRSLLRPATTFINMFGQTETTGIVCTYPVPPVAQGTAVVPIGRPISGMQAYVLDTSHRLVGAGICGDLYVSGAGVGRGYINRSDQTARNFIPNPFETGSDRLLYRTGDTARMRADGVIEFVGRSDEQIKIRGFRIEPGEIEAPIRSFAGVHECLVAAVDGDARPGIEGNRQLVAFVAIEPLQGGATTSFVERLREHLKAEVPDYMVPQRIVTLERLPRMPNGKVDRQGLFALLPGLTATDVETPELQPIRGSLSGSSRAEVVAALMRIWRKSLGRPEIRTQDNFFDVGGTSLIAVTLMLAVRERFGRSLPLATLFDAGTIDKLADLLLAEATETPWSPLVAIRPNGNRPPLFCIHPGGGNVLGYNEFIAHLDADLPVYGLQAYGVIEGQEPHTSIPEMASRYLEAIRTVQPHGPYYLGGESFGGLIAYEMACQMRSSGDRVAFLFLGDVWSCNVPQFKPWRFKLSCLPYVLSLSWPQMRTVLGRKFFGRRGPQRAFVKRYLFADELHRRNSEAHTRAAQNFFPRYFDGKVTLFRAREHGHNIGRLQAYFGGAAMNWPALASGGVDVHWMPDVHREMMHGANAHPFARRLQDCIDQAPK